MAVAALAAVAMAAVAAAAAVMAAVAWAAAARHTPRASHWRRPPDRREGRYSLARVSPSRHHRQGCCPRAGGGCGCVWGSWGSPIVKSELSCQSLAGCISTSARIVRIDDELAASLTVQFWAIRSRGRLLDLATEKGQLRKEEGKGTVPPMPLGAFVKEEDMPSDAVVKAEGVVPPMPLDAFVKVE
eukprot:scaffold16307_cov40-Phaeocystis_antarctica.AAC.1